MLNEAKIECRVMDPYTEVKLCRLIKTALIEIRTRGIEFEGDFDYTAEIPKGGTLPEVTGWTCTITDDWIKTLALTYVKANADWLDGREKLEIAYGNMLDRMMGTTGYHRGWEAEADG